MSKSNSTAIAVTVTAIVLSNPSARKFTARMLRKAAQFLDNPATPVPPPMWTEDTDDAEQDTAAEDTSKSKRISLKDFQTSN
jgi:hypothetical protein